MQADFELQRTTWQQRLDKAQQLETRLANAGKDTGALMALIEAAGYGAEDFEPLAQLFYAHSPEGQKDPRRRQAAQAALRGSAADREAAGSVAKLERELAEMKQTQTQREQEAEAQARMDRYYGMIAKAAEASTHAKHGLGKTPDRMQARLLAIADRLYVASGPSDDLRDVPAPADVLKTYETERAAELADAVAELEALGLDPKTFGRPAPTTPPAPATPPASAGPTNGNGAPAPTRRLSREELIAGIQQMKKRTAAQ